MQIKAKIEAKPTALGRDHSAFGFESIQQYSRGDNQWPGDIAAWREAGGSHISVVTMGANLTTRTVTSESSSAGVRSITRSIKI